MDLTINIEYKNMEVEFSAKPGWENDSYSDEFGLVVMPKYAAMNDTPKWDKTQHTEAENEIITVWLNENERYVNQLFIKNLEINKL